MRKKNGKLCGNFRQYYVEVSDDYAEISKLNKVLPSLGFFQHNIKIHVNIVPRILVLYDTFDILLPFVDRYFFVQRRFP